MISPIKAIMMAMKDWSKSAGSGVKKRFDTIERTAGRWPEEEEGDVKKRFDTIKRTVGIWPKALQRDDVSLWVHYKKIVYRHEIHVITTVEHQIRLIGEEETAKQFSEREACLLLYKRFTLMRATRENASFFGASLAVLGLGGGPPWSQMGDIVCLDTAKVV